MITLTPYTHLTKSLASDWQDLWERLGNHNVFQAPGWSQIYASTFPQPHYLYLAFYEGQSLVGIIGLSTQRAKWMGNYVSVAHTISHRPCFIFDPQSLQACRRALYSSSIYSSLKSLTFGNATAKELEQLTLLFGSNNLAKLSPTIFPERKLLLTPDGNLVVKARNQLLKRARPILDDLTLQTHQGETLAPGLTSAFHIDERSTKSQYHYNVFASSNERRFYLQLAKDRKLSSSLRVHLLTHKKEPIAYEIGLLVGSRYVDLERAYLATFSRYTPGKVMMVLLAENLAKQGVTLLDLGPGVDNLKRTLATGEKKRYNVVISRSLLCRYLLIFQDKLLSHLYAELFARPRLYSLYRQVKQLL